jgi:transcriptional regulatory protein RtcR
VKEEAARLRGDPSTAAESDLVTDVLGADGAARLDRFDRVQLADVLAVCRDSASLSEAGRALFAASRAGKSKVNDADRLREYLARSTSISAL